MKKNQHRFVGIFVLSGVALLILMVIYLGGDRYFTEGYRYVAYFDGSISGLRVGAPVALNGVKIGTVNEIKVLLDGKDGSITNPVIFEIDRDGITDINFVGNVGVPAAVEALVAKGLRAQLRPQSIVTGMLFIELSFLPKVELRYRNKIFPFPEVPSAPSPLQELKDTIDNLKVEDIFVRLESSLAGIDAFVNSPELTSTRDDFRRTLKSVAETSEEAKLLLAEVRGVFGENKADVERLLTNISRAAEAVGNLAGETERFLGTLGVDHRGAGGNSALRYEMLEGIKELRGAARAVKELAEYVKRNPDALVFGKKEE